MAKQILIVEDERIVAEDIRRSLENLGYFVSAVASSGMEALKKTQENIPDLALVDIVLRGTMDGIETARQMHTHFNIPVVYLTAYDDEETLHRAKTTEPYGYLLKPFKERELHTTIEMALHKHEMEKKVKENAEQLFTTISSIHHGVITTDTHGLVTFMNPAAEKLTGWSQKDAVGNPLNNVFHTLTESGQQPLVSSVLSKGTAFRQDSALLVNQNGTKLLIDERAAPLKDDEGAIIGAVVVFSDISGRQQMEEALRESEARYKALFDRTLYCIYVYDLEGRFLDANEATLHLLGYTKEEIPFLTISSLLDEDQLQKAQKITEEIVNTGSQRIPVQYRLKRKNGDYVWVETEGSLIYWYGKPYAIQGIARNITERKRAEKELKKLFEASKLINSTMDIEEIFKFISNSIHELVDFDNFIIFLVSEDGGNVYSAYPEGIKSSEQTKLQFGQEAVGQCIKTKETMLLDAGDGAHVVFGAAPASEIMIPLVIESECVGALYISKSASGYTQEDVHVLKPLGEVVSSAIQNSRLYDEIQNLNRELEQRIAERSRRTEIILSTRQSLQPETSWEKGLVTIVESMKKLGFDRCSVFLVDSMRKTLYSHFGTGFQLPDTSMSIPLKEIEYFGVKCVLGKRTIHVKDFTKVKGKQISSDSQSFVWVPIVVRGEAFAALAADNVKSGRIVTEEDVKDLEILAGMCAAFIDRTRVLIEPVAEKSLPTELKFALNVSECSIVTEVKPKKSFEIFVDLVTHGIPGFVISREFPEKVKRKYKLEKTPTVWLSKSQVDFAVDPNDLSKLMYILENFTKKSSESVVLMDGLEYLITQNGFDAVLKYLHELKDMVVLNNSRLIIPLHKEALSVREYSILERGFTILEPK